jgi:hypothetical protein
VKLSAWVGRYVAFAGPVTDEIVGAVRSITTVFDAEEFDAGPFVLVTVPNTEFARSWGVRVPSLHEDIDIVIVVPEDALGENEQPVAVPAFEKSPAAIELTFCEKVIE